MSTCPEYHREDSDDSNGQFGERCGRFKAFDQYSGSTTPLEALIAAGALVAMAAGAQHLFDRFAPNGLYRRLQERADAHAGAIVAAVAPLGDIAASFKEAEKLAKLAESMPPPDVDIRQLRASLGGDTKDMNRKMKEAKEAVGAGIVGPYLPILQQIAPQVAEYLLENPEMALEILEWPVVKKLIQKGAALLGGIKSSATEGENPFWKP